MTEPVKEVTRLQCINTLTDIMVKSEPETILNLLKSPEISPAVKEALATKVLQILQPRE